jgi:HEAT repeat protein
MRCLRSSGLALLLLIFLRPCPLPAQTPQLTPPTDEQLLRNASLPATGPALLDFFRKRSTPEVKLEQLQALIRQLADKAPDQRDRAAAELISHGPLAIPLLRQAANDLDDTETAARARQCLQQLDGSNAVAVSMAAARVLARQKPAGAAEALLAYLPFAEDDQVAEEIGKALQAVAQRDNKPDPALVEGLKDSIPVRRALAAEVLARTGSETARAAVRPLLQDARPTVRLRTALALAQSHDAEAVGVLINLLGDVPAQQSAQIEAVLTELAGDWRIAVPAGNDDLARRMRRETWAAWWRVTDGSVLLEEFHKRSLPDGEREKVQGLLKDLAGENAEARDKAQAELVNLGPVILPLLRQAAKGADARVADAAGKCLQIVEKGTPLSPLPAAAARLLAVRRPPGSVEALLAYLPFVEDEAVMNETEAALASLALADGKVEPAILAALGDKLPLRRAVAAEVVCHDPSGARLADHKSAVRPLLKDPDLTVRMRVGLALAGAQDKEAIPTLIALLADLPSEQASQVEDFLVFLAGEHAPPLSLGSDDASRTKVREAWTAWWRDRGPALDLSRLAAAQRQMGYTLVVDQYDPARLGGRVFELDAAGKQRWSIDKLQNPTDAQVLPGGTVLIVEQGSQRISERDLKGNVVWQKLLPGVPLMGAQRLRNGHYFVVTRNRLFELDKDGKDLWTYNRPQNDIMTARKLRDGRYVLVNWQGIVTRLDAEGKEVKTVHLPLAQFGFNPAGVDFLPNDHVVVAHTNHHKVIEYDGAGKAVWEAAVQFPYAVERLANGRTLVSSLNTLKIVELDRAGKVVWEVKESVRGSRVHRR